MSPEIPLRLFGHQDVVVRFSDDLPFNIVLIGQPGIGKRRLAQVLAQQHAKSYDILTVDSPVVGIDNMRAASKFVSKRPFGSKYKIVVIAADGMTDAAAQALLRVLEEAHSRVRLILSTAGHLPLTILSRCVVVRCQPLTSDEVRDVLSMLGFNSDMAGTAASLSGGSVSSAMEYLRGMDRRQNVLSVVQLLMQRKVEAVVPHIRKWEEPDIVELAAWFEDLTLAKYSRTSHYTARELQVGSSLSAESIERNLKLLRTPMRPSLKMLYLAVRMLEEK